VVDYRIVESAGATEGAPAVGTAEMIVDITTTGATLAANGLKVLDDGVILRSQANLVASRDADWSSDARETARVILDHIAARARASNTARSARALPAATTRCWPKRITASAWWRRSAGRPRRACSRCTARRRSFTRSAAFLRDHGADTVSVASLDYVLDRENPLFASLRLSCGSERTAVRSSLRQLAAGSICCLDHLEPDR
jgi:ATP phosphoribosyltransferase